MGRGYRLLCAAMCAGMLFSQTDFAGEVESDVLIEDDGIISSVGPEAESAAQESVSYQGLPIGKTLAGLGAGEEEDDGGEFVFEEAVSESELLIFEGETEEEETDAADLLTREMQEIFQNMTMQEKAAQLFIVTPEALTGVDIVAVAGETTRQALEETPVGGLVYAKKNLSDRQQISDMLSGVQDFSVEASGLPLYTFVAEEGGSASLLGGAVSGIEAAPSMASLGEAGDAEAAREAGQAIGTYLAQLGFTCNLAPVANLSAGEMDIEESRLSGTDAETTAQLNLAFAEGLEAQGVSAVYKYFPGDPQEDELRVFRAVVEGGAQMILADQSASISQKSLTEQLRDQMGYDGIIIADLTGQEMNAAAAVAALDAGADMLMVSSDFQEAYESVLTALEDGDIDTDRLERSVIRILCGKQAQTEASEELQTE